VITETEAREVVGSTAYASDGEKLGKVGQLFLDDNSGRPEFVTVNTGLFGTKETFVPVSDANYDGGELRVPYPKDKVKGAPNVDLNGSHLDQSEENRLYEYYGLTYDAPATDTTTETTGRTAGTGVGDVASTGHDTSGPNTDDAMTRSEERVDVGTASQEAGRVRLRKYVTTETETRSVPVRKERAVLETEPITEGNAGEALDGPEISEEEHEVVLHEEKPVVQKTTEPVERVRLGTETETEEQTVSEEVRKENIDVDDPEGRL
jgi:uncharacterized protein (TIGR02271 family)